MVFKERAVPWFDPSIPADIPQSPQIVINDSKTPSGRVHVGALRGVVIHDAVFRTLKRHGRPVRYLFGVDDYDPLDELPAGQGDHFRKYLGQPLCVVPPPPGSTATDMAEHYIGEFFEVFRQLGVHAETYRMRDVYRSGRFNEAIDIILRHADVVRKVYKEVSNAERPATWLPFQAICEQCGRIGTTEVSEYSGGMVTYRCRPDLVTWAQGCGNTGRVSPFDGRGKLPWKLEWVAKWRTFPVTVEGAGKDHTTRGGSRDVAAACLKEIFGQEAPLNVPYEFFLVEGAKMSSSRGIGASAKDMASFLPPEILRFLILRTQPQRPVNFSLDEDFIVKLFNEFDRYHHRTYHDPEVREDEKQLYLLSEVEPEGAYFDAGFQLVLTLLQMPHIDVLREVEKRKGEPLDEVELRHFEQRRHAARVWLDSYAREEDKLRLQEALPARAAELTTPQRAFLHGLAAALPDTPRKEAALQGRIFDVARLTPIEQPEAFQALYRVLFDRDSGPKAGSFLPSLDQDFLVKRFQELPFSVAELWSATGRTPEAFATWLAGERKKMVRATATPEWLALEGGGMGAVEVVLELADGKKILRRVMLDVGRERLEGEARAWAEKVGKDTGLPVAVGELRTRTERE